MRRYFRYFIAYTAFTRSYLSPLSSGAAKVNDACLSYGLRSTTQQPSTKVPRVEGEGNEPAAPAIQSLASLGQMEEMGIMKGGMEQYHSIIGINHPWVIIVEQWNMLDLTFGRPKHAGIP